MSTPAHRHYNVGWLEDDELLNAFVARRNEFSFLRDELTRVPPEGNVQHYLLVGVRGAGKTTMLKRLSVAIRRDADLKDHLIALSFPEELYQVKNLADFWWAACDALADELDRLDRKAELDALEALIQGARATRSASDPLSSSGLDVLLQTCKQLNRRPVLLVDNLDMVFERIDKTGRKLNDKHAPAYWALREALSTSQSPVVIGGSVRLSESFTSYDAAFYDFFLPKRLGKLTLAEVREVLERLADAQGAPEVKERLRARPGRIETLFELTGGNPRALGLIFELLRSGPNSRAVEDFERLMDLTTPYYKARIEDLSEQAQAIMHALAVREASDGLRFGHTAAEIGVQSGLQTTSVSAQLTLLENEGLVEKSTAHGKAQYRIAEQLFRLWLQMRGTRRIRQNVILLTKFFEALYDFDELNAKLREHCGASALSEAKYAFAIAGTQHASTQRKELEAYGADRLLEHLAKQGGNLDDYLPEKDGLSPDAQQTEQEQSTLESALAYFNKGREQFEAGLGDDAEKSFRNALDLAPSLGPLWIALGLTLERHPSRAGDAEAAYRKGIELAPDIEMGWRHLGDILARDPNRYNEAAEALRVATEKDPTEAEAWHSLGAFLDDKLRQPDDAATAYRKVLELNPDHVPALARLGFLLSKREGGKQEAEACVRKAIDLEPDNELALLVLVALLQPDRIAEAESVLRKALTIAPASGAAWFALGLINEETQNLEEAEAAYRKGTELIPHTPFPWFALGSLIGRAPERYNEAEIALRKAHDLAPTDPRIACRLGLVLAALGQEEEALSMLEVGIKSGQELPDEVTEVALNLRVRILLRPAKDALSKGDRKLLRKVLADMLTVHPGAAEALVSLSFVEEFLKPALAEPDSAKALMAEMRDLGYERYGRPLMLALEAAIENREDMLGELEPELQKPTKRMFARLTGADEHQAE